MNAEEKRPTWHERIDAAEKRGGFTSKDRNDADDWVTCACGEQDERIRWKDGIPSDAILATHGLFFSDAVAADDFDGARLTLAAIERRAAQLLAGHTEESR